jgi:surface polysaccharide O-acyltransferase-like enzyme
MVHRNARNYNMVNQAGSIQRRVDLDWLRVIGILTVFIFHSVHFFDTGDWSVKNSTHYAWVDIFMSVLASWMMPIFFVISGAAVYFVINRSGFGKFAKDKVLRLAVPLVVGVFTHAAWQVYLERISHGQFDGSFWQFIPHYFDGLYGFGGNFAWMGLHLWYLLVLFLYSLLLYPLFRWLSGGGRAVLGAIGEFLARPGAIYPLALPIMLLISILDPSKPLGRRDFGGWSLLPHLLFFVYGFIMISNDRLQQNILKLRWVSLAGGVVAFVALRLSRVVAAPAYGNASFILVNSLYALMGWFLLLAILGFGMRLLTKTTPLLQYANDAVLPFYILHQTVLFTIGYVVVQMPIPDLLKWAVIAAASFGICMGLYELLIRRINALRFLFGMRQQRRVPSVAGTPVTATVGR